MTLYSAENSKKKNKKKFRPGRRAVQATFGLDQSQVQLRLPGYSANGRLAPRLSPGLTRSPVSGRPSRPKAQSVPAAAQLRRSPGRAGFALHRVGRQREKCAVGKFQIPAIDLHLVAGLAFGSPAFDHELGADRKAAGETT